MGRWTTYLLTIVSLTVIAACSSDQTDRDTGVPAPDDATTADVADTDDPSPDDTGPADTGAPADPDTATDTGGDTGVPDTGSSEVGTDAADADGDADTCGTDSDSDGLTDCEEAELCTDPNDGDTDGDNLGDFEELQYQTDPCDPDTDNDGATDGQEVDFGFDPNRPNEDLWALRACDTPDAEPVDFHKNATGNWTLALPPAFDNYTEPSISTAAKPVAAALYDDPATEVAGALLSKQAEPNHTSPTEPLRGRIRNALESVGTVDQDQTGAEFTTHDDKVAAVGHYLVRPEQRVSTRRVRESLLFELAPFPKADVSGLPTTAGAPYEAFQISVSVIFRNNPSGRDQSLISLSVSPNQKYQSLDRVRFRMDDLTNTTNIAEQVDSHLTKCTTEPASEKTPKAEFYWVLDQSGSMDTDNQKVADFAEQFQTEVQNTPLDFQMGVTNMVPANDGHLRVPPAWHTAPSTFRQEINEAVIGCTESASWECDNSDEYGLQVAKQGIRYMTGNASATPTPAERVRSGAEIITIFMSDEEANTIQEDNDPVDPFLKFFPGRTTAFAIVGDGDGCGRDGKAYKDVALETGGKFASLCADDLTQTIRDIIIATTGRTSQYILPQTPISSSLRVFLDGEWVPRSQEDGFEYFEEHNAIAFFGSYQPTPGSDESDGPGDYIAVHYETFKDRCKNTGSNNCSP